MGLRRAVEFVSIIVYGFLLDALCLYVFSINFFSFSILEIYVSSVSLLVTPVGDLFFFFKE